ncbi:tetratricopeptide repeat protein [Phragmitibacter flavus]|uniref:Tetratricopeptide repeat protein n=1 Tax=Phragmitibacter flavus TaxID=2576071 RepID=A0A5R8KA96_9BACT|nr:tetratricopeptide repeat protein [Phragmitibacter flavus]TLD69228.1 tetratricopeptide repeat protein [Phragmitibacter flavus]
MNEKNWKLSAESWRFATSRSLSGWWAGLVACAVFVVFGGSIGHDFINYDDPVMVYENPSVAGGLTSANARWALTSTGDTNLWHPLTWLSHQLDCTLFGVDHPGAHHAVNVGFHAATAILLGSLLVRLTGWHNIGWLLALAWALHPQRVQSVAWISERKDVLSGLWILLSLRAWLAWRDGGRRRHYFASNAATLLALLSKPIAVALPIALLLLDCWHRRRIPDRNSLMALAPSFVAALAGAAVTVHFQVTGGMGEYVQSVSSTSRLAVVPLTLAFQFLGLIWPVSFPLWIYPPDAESWPWFAAVGCASIAFMAAAVYSARREPLVWLGTGWLVAFWLPVSGLVPLGFYFVADRYTYLPHIGLWLMLAGFGCHWRAWLRRVRGHLSLAAALVILFYFAFSSWRQNMYWKDSETLFQHEMSINPRSLLAPIHLGQVRDEQGRLEDALTLFEKAVAIDNRSALAEYNRGMALRRLGQTQAAKTAFHAACDKHPSLPDAYVRLAIILLEEGNLEEAETILDRGIDLHPKDFGLFLNRASLRAVHLRRITEAVSDYLVATKLAPSSADAWQGLAIASLEIGDTQTAHTALANLRRTAPERTDVAARIEARLLGALID